MNAAKKIRASEAFTLIEMVTTLAIAVIIIGMGVGFSSASFSKKRALLRVSNKVELMVRQASMTASLERRDVFLTLFEQSLTAFGHRIDLAEGRLQMMSGGSAAKWVTPPPDGYVWKFGASPFSEPITLKLIFPQASCVLGFDPLTGECRERLISLL